MSKARELLRAEAGKDAGAPSPVKARWRLALRAVAEYCQSRKFSIATSIADGAGNAGILPALGYKQAGPDGHYCRIDRRRCWGRRHPAGSDSKRKSK